MTLAGADQVTGTVALVAQPPPSTPGDPGGGGEDTGKSSPMGLFVVLLLLVAVVLLARSMTKHLRRVPASFDEPVDGRGPETAPPAEGDQPAAGDSGDGPDRKA